MWAVAFGESEHACTVAGDQEVAVTQAIRGEHFLADEGFDSAGHHLLDFGDL